MHCGYFDTTRKGNHSSFLTPTVVAGDAPFCLKFTLKVTHPFQTRRLRQTFTYNVSTVRDSEKSFITTNRKSTTGFPTSCIWSAYINHKCPKGWLKSDFLFIHMFIQHKSDTSRVIIKFGDVDCAFALYALCCWIHSNCFVNISLIIYA